MSEEEVSEMCAQVALAINKRFNPMYNYLYVKSPSANTSGLAKSHRYVYTARKPVRNPPDPETARPEDVELGASDWDFDGASRLKRKRTR